jgi:hypothetical protein
MATTQPQNPLTAAALAFEQELSRYEKICTELHRSKVTSQKTLTRTQRLLGESVECEEELGGKLRLLLEAMNGARDKQQTSMEWALAAAQDLQKRADMFSELLARVNALGEQARDISGPVAAIVAEKDAGASADRLLTLLHGVSAKMTDIIREATALEKAADDEDWPELAREVRSLKQQVQSAHGKVVSTCGNVGARASS